MAAEHYKRAIEAGETLASANLAQMFLDTGLTQEASEIIKKARSHTTVHPNVNNASVRLQTIRKDSSELEGKVLATGAKIRQFLLRFSGTCHEKFVLDRGGMWKSPNGQPAEVTPLNERNIRVEWTTSEPGLEKYRAALQLFGRFGAGDVKKWKIDPYAGLFDKTKEKGSFEDFGSGQMFFSDDGNKLCILVTSKEQTTVSEWLLTKGPAPPAESTPAHVESPPQES